MVWDVWKEGFVRSSLAHVCARLELVRDTGKQKKKRRRNCWSR